MPLRRLAPLLWILLCLAALEVALEVRATRLGWPTVLFGGAAGEAHGDPSWGPTESFPFRSRIVAPERKDGVVRLWFASASYGEDVQQAPADVFPNLTAERLNARGSACEALNASWAGASIPDNVDELQASGARYRPQLVVLYQMSNDIDELSVALCSRGWRPLAEREAPSEALGPLLGEGAAAEQTPTERLHRLVEDTTVYKHLKSGVSARLAGGRRLASTLGEEGERMFEARVRRFLARVRELGAEPVLCTFPTAYTLATRESTPREFELNLLRFNVFLSLQGWLDSVERFNGVLRRVAVAEGVALIDLASTHGGRAELFRDMWHLTRDGHAQVAERLADELARTQALARRAPR